MPLKYFICPDGNKEEAAKCMNGECRFPHRCHPLTYLKAAGRERKWTGKGSVTQLITGTRESFLKIMEDYSIDPDSKAYAILGTTAHAVMNVDNDHSFTEEFMEDDYSTGTADNIEQQPNGEWWLIDEKTSGSYKIAKALGLTYDLMIMTDENGSPVLGKRGKYAGKPKKIKVFRIGEVSREDILEWIWQLNSYRMKTEKELSIKISRLMIHGVVRDGKTMVAKERGVLTATVYIEIPIIPDEEVTAYFKRKSEALINAINSNTLPAECNFEETWGGVKCNGYCDVVENCKAHGCHWFKAIGADDGDLLFSQQEGGPK